MVLEDNLNAQRRHRRQRLAQYGFRPDVVFDIGVCRGTPWLYRAFPDARFVLIDPLAEAGENLAARDLDIAYDFHQLALSDTDGTRSLDVPLEDADSRVLALTSFHHRIDQLAEKIGWTETRTVTTARLDSVAARYEGRLGLKIDTEGHELAVLKGATESLKRADFVILELTLTHRFDNSGPPSEIMTLLAGSGLEFRDVLATSFPPADVPRHMDVLFTPWQNGPGLAEDS